MLTITSLGSLHEFSHKGGLPHGIVLWTCLELEPLGL